jgi:hypothetical protein
MSNNQEPSLSLREFHNLLRLLCNIDHYEVADAFKNREDWRRFVDHPWKWFIQADDRKVEIIWQRMMERNHV